MYAIMFILRAVYTGEFGIVYRGLLLPKDQQKTMPKVVAVKTLKGYTI